MLSITELGLLVPVSTPGYIYISSGFWTQACKSSTLLTDQSPHLKQACFRGLCSSSVLDKTISWHYSVQVISGGGGGESFATPPETQLLEESGNKKWNETQETEARDKRLWFHSLTSSLRLIHSFSLEESFLLRAFICKTKDRIKMSPCTQMTDLPFSRPFVETQL